MSYPSLILRQVQHTLRKPSYSPEWLGLFRSRLSVVLQKETFTACEFGQGNAHVLYADFVCPLGCSSL